MSLKRKLLLSFLIVLIPLSISAVSWELYFEIKMGLNILLIKIRFKRPPKVQFLCGDRLFFRTLN